MSSDSVDLTRTVVLKAGNAFLVSEPDGDMPVDGEHALGVYRDDGRFLLGHELRVGGARPRLLVASAPTGARVRPRADQPRPGAARTAAGCRCRRSSSGSSGGLPATATLAGAAARPPLRARAGRARARARARRRLPADARAARDGVGGRAPRCASSAAADGVRFAARGATACCARPRSRADPAAGQASGGRAALPLRAGARRGARRCADVPAAGGRRGRAGGAAHGRAAIPRRPDARRADDELFNRVLERSLLDLRMLRSALDGHGVLRRRHPVVRDAVRSRQPDQRRRRWLALAPDDGRADAARARRPARPRVDPRARGGAGQGDPRAARRRGRARSA